MAVARGVMDSSVRARCYTAPWRIIMRILVYYPKS